jgi:hypothetical protein
MDEYYRILLEDVDNPKCDFYLLYKNGKCYFEEFVDSLTQKSDLAELDKIRALMDIDVAQLPPTKFRHIVGGKYDRKDVYEFKSKHLRVYTLKVQPDFYIVLGGYKKGQEKDIAKIFNQFNQLPPDIVIKKNH